MSCKFLETFYFTFNVDKVNEYMFADCISLTKVAVPHFAMHFGDYAFANCISLVDLNWETISHTSFFPNCIFKNCSSLTNVTIPSSIRHIYNNAFSYCTSLSLITFDSTTNLLSCFINEIL